MEAFPELVAGLALLAAGFDALLIISQSILIIFNTIYADMSLQEFKVPLLILIPLPPILLNFVILSKSALSLTKINQHQKDENSTFLLTILNLSLLLK